MRPPTEGARPRWPSLDATIAALAEAARNTRRAASRATRRPSRSGSPPSRLSARSAPQPSAWNCARSATRSRPTSPPPWMTGKTTWTRRLAQPFASSTKASRSRSRPLPATSWSAIRISQTDGSSSATSMRSGAKTERPSPAIVVCWRSSTARRTTSTQSTHKGSKTGSPNSISRRPPEPRDTIEFADGSSHVDLANHDQQAPTAPSNTAAGLNDADVWSKIVAKYGLVSGDLRAFVGQGDQHADFAFAYGAPAGPVAFVSTVKLRKAGFNAAIDTRDAFSAALLSFIDRK